MKNIKSLSLCILLVLFISTSQGQRKESRLIMASISNNVEIGNSKHKNSNSGNAIIYIGSIEKNPTLIQYFHNEKLIGFTEKNDYFIYKCSPGKQLFWSKIFPISKNSPRVESFLELDIEANKTYYLDTKTYTVDGKNITKSFKKDRGNLIHKLILVNDNNSIGQFNSIIDKKKPEKFKPKKMKKYNEELYSEIATSLYEYNKTKGNSSHKPQISSQKNITQVNNSNSDYSSYSLNQLEKSKQKLLEVGNFSAAQILQEEINNRNSEDDNIQTSYNDKSIEELEYEKQAAIENEDYQLANELKEAILAKKEAIALKKEQGNINIEKLYAQKEEAISQENYLLAEELNQQIKSLKEKDTDEELARQNQAKIETLEKEKAEAIANEDYILAEELKAKISVLKSVNNTEEETAEVKETDFKLTTITEKENSIDLSNFSNQREASLAAFTKRKNTSINNSSSGFTKNYANSYRTQKISKSKNNRTADVTSYSRSSLYTLMLNNQNREHANTIKDAFGNTKMLDKFNDHNIGPYLIDIQYQERDQSSLITNFLDENEIAKEMVAKWFNRNEKGEFNMDLVTERGYYDAKAIDISIAKNSERGMSMLADAGENLIGNTFVIVNDYKFTNKEGVAKKASGWLNTIANVAAYVPGGSTVSNVASYTSVGASVFGKGYVIKTTSYLYKLVWNDEISTTFYNDYWIDKDNYNPNKKSAFDNSNLFRLELIGSENAWADIQSTVFTSKSNEELIEIATIKATNKAIAKLQRKFELFRTKSPLLSGDPITAKIGLKEGVEKGDKYEVLEIIQDENGNRRYKRVGVIKVDKHKIWDNRFMATEENGDSQFEYTTFKGPKNKFIPGMLIRQIN